MTTRDKAILYYVFYQGNVTYLEMSNIFKVHGSTIKSYMNHYFSNKAHYNAKVKTISKFSIELWKNEYSLLQPLKRGSRETYRQSRLSTAAKGSTIQNDSSKVI